MYINMSSGAVYSTPGAGSSTMTPADFYTFAKKDISTRPENIDANELAAWIAYLSGDYAAAKTYADNMLKTKVKNPATLYKAAMIYKQSGNGAMAETLMQEAVAMNPNVATQINTLVSK